VSQTRTVEALLKLLEFKKVGRAWYQPNSKQVFIEAAPNQEMYSLAKEAWLKDPDLNVQTFPWEAVTPRQIVLTPGWKLLLEDEDWDAWEAESDRPQETDRMRL
jgi:hypothetical protein